MDSPGEARRGSIVLADDSTTIQKVVQLSFADENIEVRIFSDGKSALNDIVANGADAVLVDISLPEMDGYELCRTLKANPVLEELPVILLAGTFEPFDVDKAERAGYAGSLTKPFETSQLVSLVKELLDKDTGTQQTAASREASEGGQSIHRGNFPVSPTLKPAGGDLIIALTPAECQPSFRLLERELVGSIQKQKPTSTDEEVVSQQRSSQEAEVLTQEQLDLFVHRLSERLPDTLKSLLPEVVEETLKKPE